MRKKASGISGSKQLLFHKIAKNQDTLSNPHGIFFFMIIAYGFWVYLYKNRKIMKTKVWPLSVRIFHWLVAIGFVSAYVLGEEDEYRNFHIAFGLMVGSLIVLRLIYGMLGTKYTRFSAFPIGIKHQFDFIRSFYGKTKTYLGHNPLAALAMLGILVVGLLTALTGFLMYGGENGIVSISVNKHTLEESHEVLANLFLILVLFHLAGLLVEWFFHKSHKTALSMFNGVKNIEGDNYKTTVFQKFFGIIWVIIPLFIFFTSLKFQQKNITDKRTEHEHNERHDE